jgi:superfamily II DNA/RNA helicase
MDKLFNAGKDFLEERSNQGQASHGGSASFFGGNNDDDEFRKAKEEAANRAGSSGSSDMFSSIISAIGQKKSQVANEDLDEEDAIKKHKKTYESDDEDDDEDTLGAAAAMQALKMFNKGETGEKQSQGAFLGLAMSEASKLFDAKSAKGKVSSGASKESTIQKAGEMAMKMYFKSQGQSQGGLMGLASKFM